MSSNELTSHLHSFPVSFTFMEPMQRLCHPAPFHSFQSYLFNYLSLCTYATQLMCEPCNVLQSGPRFDFLQRFFSFCLWNLCSASAIQFPMDLCSASAIQPISFHSSMNLCSASAIQFISFFSLVVSQNSQFNSNCKSQVPNSLSCFSL